MTHEIEAKNNAIAQVEETNLEREETIRELYQVTAGEGGGTVLVPVRLAEHARFRLRDPDSQTGAGQGAGEPGQVLRPGQPQPGDEQGSEAGSGQGDLQFVLELKVDDVLDWLWEELKLPDLKPKTSGRVEDDEFVREGWDKRGVRSRLDRRRTVKQAIRRRAIQEDPAPFVDDDLRFRQLVRRHKPATNAAVIFALDVSGSMGETERQLAKTFFFFALQGIRRQYGKVETAFLAHSAEAWEFSEAQFFQTSGTGGTVSSTVFTLAKDVIRDLKAALKDADELYLATDEDREGEAISWHLLEVLKPSVPVRRMVFHEITRSAIEHAIELVKNHGLDF